MLHNQIMILSAILKFPHPLCQICHVSNKIILAMSRGALVVFEGCDKVGKSTQVKRLLEALAKAGVTNKNLKFPGIN